jgi:hypothetical protein
VLKCVCVCVFVCTVCSGYAVMCTMRGVFGRSAGCSVVQISMGGGTNVPR